MENVTIAIELGIYYVDICMMQKDSFDNDPAFLHLIPPRFWGLGIPTTCVQGSSQVRFGISPSKKQNNMIPSVVQHAFQNPEDEQALLLLNQFLTYLLNTAITSLKEQLIIDPEQLDLILAVPDFLTVAHRGMLSRALSTVDQLGDVHLHNISIISRTQALFLCYVTPPYQPEQAIAIYDLDLDGLNASVFRFHQGIGWEIVQQQSDALFLLPIIQQSVEDLVLSHFQKQSGISASESLRRRIHQQVFSLCELLPFEDEISCDIDYYHDEKEQTLSLSIPLEELTPCFAPFREQIEKRILSILRSVSNTPIAEHYFSGIAWNILGFLEDFFNQFDNHHILSSKPRKCAEGAVLSAHSTVSFVSPNARNTKTRYSPEPITQSDAVSIPVATPAEEQTDSSTLDSATSGTMDLFELSSDGTILLRLTERGKASLTLEIPMGVIIIGADAFAYCNAQRILLPNGLKQIKEGAFLQCRNLTHIDLPMTLQQLGEDTFARCSQLVSVTIPDRVQDIPNRCFCQCVSLQHLTLSNSLLHIGSQAFAFCNLLANPIIIPEAVQSIEDDAFEQKHQSKPHKFRLLNRTNFKGLGKQVLSSNKRCHLCGAKLSIFGKCRNKC